MRIILTILFVYSTLLLFSQNQNNVWYFGNNAGVDFNYHPPVALTNGMLSTGEGCASICDASGHLLFYTDGMTIYNRNHTIMPNGSGLAGNWSSTQSAIIVPQPNSLRYYYVFTLDAFAGPNGFCYSVVDIYANGGLGAITAKNRPILTPTAEKIVAVKHTNNRDFWLVVHGWDNNNFYSYKLTPSGFDSIPVITSIGNVYSGGGGQNDANNAIGYMKISPDRTKIALAICIDSKYELYHFNPATGVLSDFIEIPEPTNVMGARTYGVEFSPNSRYLYLKNFYSYSVYQYDLINYNSPAIIGSKQYVGDIYGQSIYGTGAMQLGPDNKIYIVKYLEPYLGVINHPDNPASSCGLQDNAVGISGRTCELGLPCLVQNIFFDSLAIYATGCYLGPYVFSLNISSNITTFHWNFNDPLSSSNTSDDSIANHTFTQAGNYHVSLVFTTEFGVTDTEYFDVNATIPPDLISDDTIYSCTDQPVLISVNGNFNTYLWSTGSHNSSITVSSDGLYSVTVTQNNCLIIDSVLVILYPPPNVNLGNDTSICSGEQLELNALTPGASYIWQNGSRLPAYTVTEPGSYWVQVDVGMCSSSDTINVSLINLYLYLGDDAVLCPGDELLINPEGNYDSVIWNGSLRTDSFMIAEPGIYYASAFKDGCMAMDSIRVTGCSEIWLPNAFSPNGDHINDVFKPTSINLLDFDMLIFNRWGTLLYETKDVSKGWDGKYNGMDCPQGVYFCIVYFKFANHNDRKSINGIITLLR